MEKKKSFLFYVNWENQINDMTDVEMRRFIKNLCRYSNDEEVELPTRIERAFWNGILPALEINKSKYEKKVEASKENGKLGGAPKGNQNARKEETTQNNLNKVIRDNSKEISDKSKKVNVNREMENDKSELEKDNWQEKNVNSEMLIENRKEETDKEIIELSGSSMTGANESYIVELQDKFQVESSSLYKTKIELASATNLGDRITGLVATKDLSKIEERIGKEKLEEIMPLIDEYYEKETLSRSTWKILGQEIDKRNKPFSVE